jgi:hypothetical protein
MSDLLFLYITTFLLTLLSVGCLYAAYIGYKHGRMSLFSKKVSPHLKGEASMGFFLATPGFIGAMTLPFFTIMINDEYTKLHNIKEFNDGKRAFWCKESKESGKLVSIELNGGFIYDADKDAFVNKNKGVAYSFRLDGEKCK